jgi:hypothetical protein
MTVPPDRTAIVRDPEWLPHRYDPVGDKVHFVRVTREAHRAATFLTDVNLPSPDKPVVIDRRFAVEHAGASAPVHFIFHSAFCGSTLLARAFDLPGVAMGLKEPVILNDLVGWRLRGAQGRDVAERMDHALRLLGRPFVFGESVIIKPSNLVNGLAEAMMKLRPDSKTLLLHAPLDVYLGSVARKELEGRLWVRDLMVKLLKEGLINLGLDQEDYLRLTDLQSAAVGWLAQHALFHRLVEAFPDRIVTLDSETLVSQAGPVLNALTRHFGLSLDHAGVAAVVNGPVFAKDSKRGGSFSAEERQRVHADGAERHADEIGKVLHWATLLADTAGVGMALPNALI